MSRLVARLLALLRPSRLRAEIAEELEGHMLRETERAIAAGMNPDDARLFARRAVGNPTVHRESAEDAYGLYWLASLQQDIRYALRGLRRSPAFAVTAGLSLGVGIGATTAVFTALDALVFRKLAARAPDELVTLEQTSASGTRIYNYGLVDYERFRTLDVFSGMFATAWADGFNVGTNGPTGNVDETQTRVSVVTGTMFDVLGLRAQVGRLLDESDDVTDGGTPVVVISDAYWARRFSRARDVVGRTVSMLGTTYTIVGVAPRSFQGDWVGWPTDLWIPVAMAHQVFPSPNPSTTRGANRQFKIVARLRPGVSTARAEAAGAIVHDRIAAEAPSGSGVDKNARFHIVTAASGYSRQRETFQQPLMILFAAGSIVLLIACANVANLLLARATARDREMTIRLAIGAGPMRLFRQLFTESLVLALLGGGLGVALARVGTAVLASFGRAGPASSVTFGTSAVILDLQPSGRILAFSTIVCIVTGVLFGVAPAAYAARTRLVASPTVRRHHGLRWLDARGVLLTAQVTLSLVLVVGAGLLARTMVNLRTANLGFDRQQLLFVWTLPGYEGRPRTELLALFKDLEQRVGSLPGVASAAATVAGMLADAPAGGAAMRAEGADAAVRITPSSQMNVGPGYFSTIGQGVVAGATFSASDGDSTRRVMIVDEHLARRLFHDANAVGKRVMIGGAANGQPYEVVGVVSSTRVTSPRDSGGMVAYFPYMQSRNLSRLCLVVRHAGSATDVAARVRAELRARAPSLPILRIDTADEQLDDALFRDRLIANVAIFFAAVAMLLACIGLYGLTSYTTARRTNEVGVRIALGAAPTEVLVLMLERSLGIVATGVGLGIAVSLVTNRFISSRLYGVGAFDPTTLIGAAILLIVVTGVASLVPARHAARIDPVRALRAD